MNKIIAVVGMPGSGKSEVVNIFEEHGFSRVYFGGVVIEEVRKLGLDVNEKNESNVRKDLRRKYGLDAIAKLSLPKIREALKKYNVVIDGLYSWEEYKLLVKEFPNMVVIAVYAPPDIRYSRLEKRQIRSLSPEEAKSRDYDQIENLHTGGPIAMADFTIKNEGSLKTLIEKTKLLIKEIGE